MFQKRKKKKHILKHIFRIFLICVIICILDLVASYKLLTVHNETITSDKIQKDTKIVMIADLHDGTFGKENQRLVNKIKKQKPDLILMVGDMLNSGSENCDIPVTLIQKLKKVAPIYYALGNQEIENQTISLKKQKQQIEAAGATVLDQEYAQIVVNDNKLRVGGLYDYAFGVDGAGNMSKKDMKKDVVEYLEEFQDTDAFTIMMSHRPDSFVFANAYDTWKIDLVVSGHLHGGQVVIPLKGGLYGADLGWFPEYAKGMFHFDGVKNMYVTSGLGSDKEKLPRFNNIPEIVVLNLKRK